MMAREQSGSTAQRAFDGIGVLSTRLSRPARPLLDRVFARLLPPQRESARLDWAGDADWARLQQIGRASCRERV